MSLITDYTWFTVCDLNVHTQALFILHTTKRLRAEKQKQKQNSQMTFDAETKQQSKRSKRGGKKRRNTLVISL